MALGRDSARQLSGPLDGPTDMPHDPRTGWTHSLIARLVVGLGSTASVFLALLDLGAGDNPLRFEEVARASMLVTTVGALAIATRLPTRAAWSTGVGLALLAWVFLLGFVPRTDHFARRLARSSLFDGLQAETALWLLGTGRVEDARWYDLGPGVEEPALHDDWRLGPQDRSVLLLKYDAADRVAVVRILRAPPSVPRRSFDANG